MNASQDCMLLGTAGSPGQVNCLSDAGRATANVLRDFPPGHMHEAHRQELAATLAKAQALIAGGRVATNDALRSRHGLRQRARRPALTQSELHRRALLV